MLSTINRRSPTPFSFQFFKHTSTIENELAPPSTFCPLEPDLTGEQFPFCTENQTSEDSGGLMFFAYDSENENEDITADESCLADDDTTRDSNTDDSDGDTRGCPPAQHSDEGDTGRDDTVNDREAEDNNSTVDCDDGDAADDDAADDDAADDDAADDDAADDDAADDEDDGDDTADDDTGKNEDDGDDTADDDTGKNEDDGDDTANDDTGKNEDDGDVTEGRAAAEDNHTIDVSTNDGEVTGDGDAHKDDHGDDGDAGDGFAVVDGSTHDDDRGKSEEEASIAKNADGKGTFTNGRAQCQYRQDATKGDAAECNAAGNDSGIHSSTSNDVMQNDGSTGGPAGKGRHRAEARRPLPSVRASARERGQKRKRNGDDDEYRGKRKRTSSGDRGKRRNPTRAKHSVQNPVGLNRTAMSLSLDAEIVGDGTESNPFVIS